jgi:hypothetical protein
MEKTGCEDESVFVKRINPKETVGKEAKISAC